MRVTTFMMADRYINRMSGALERLDYANRQAGTGRRFFKASEDPAAATALYKYRRQQAQISDYDENLKDVISTKDSQFSSMNLVNKSLEDAFDHLEYIMNGPVNQKEIKQITAQQIRGIQETVVKDMNAKYGDRFLFGGSAVGEAPFELKVDKEKGDKLYYRGIDVSGEEDYVYPPGSHLEGTVVKGTKNGSNDVLNLLKKLADDDPVFIDMGFGLDFNGDKNLNQSSAFNVSTSGLSVLGYGGTKEQPNNAVLMLGAIAKELEHDVDTSRGLDLHMTNFRSHQQRLRTAIAKIDTDRMFLNYTDKRLDEQDASIKEKISQTWDIDAEKAIMDLNQQDYLYQLMLRTGNKLLSNSFIDFMN
jgi:hypothetical protein